MPDSLSQTIADYRAATSPVVRRELLRNLATAGDEASLATFAELVASEPPGELQDALVAFGPLFQREAPLAAAALFPRLLDAVAHPTIASIAIDAANYFTRTGALTVHPASERRAALVALLNSIVVRLGKLEAGSADEGVWEEHRRQAEEGVSLFISLADALALIGDRSAIAALKQGAELHHRRLRTEAAAALARLGDDAGVDMLVALTAEPVVRARATAYLDELSHGDRVPQEYRTPEAVAAGKLAQHLAAPLQFGLAPQSIELLDHRRQHWPGFDRPVDTFLFRFAYVAAGGEYRGVGIVGPMVRVLACDVEDLPPNDIYALFAGWQAEHDSIRETAVADLPVEEQARIGEVWEELGEGLSDVTPVLVGDFFGHRYLVATAMRSGDAGVMVSDGAQSVWYRAGNAQRPITAADAYHMHKGRQLLHAFNPR
jgi:hypothetical protein